VTSFREELAIQRNLTSLLPVPFTLENWRYILSSSKLVRMFFNSLFVSSTHTILQIMLCSIAAYAFARIPFKGKKPLYMLVLAGLMVPGQATFIPVYLLVAKLDLHNTYAALIIPGIASSFAVFLLVQFFEGIPKELEEAAYLDGASYFTVYWRIIMPLSGPVLTTLAIFTFLGNWNSYLWPLVSATNEDVMTVTVGLNHITTSWGFVEFFGRIMAAAWAGVVPILIFYFIFQQKIVKGIQFNTGIQG
jgi:multiple sugar transport system permease protein